MLDNWRNIFTVIALLPSVVPTRNSVHSVIVDVRSIGLLPSRGHESCPIVVSFYAALVFTVTSKYANRDSCAASSTCCVAASEKAGEPRSSRPFALGTAFTYLESMALSAGSRQTGNSNCVAPKRISPLLALEE